MDDKENKESYSAPRLKEHGKITKLIGLGHDAGAADA
jgi:hypothetical protein